MLNLAKFRAVGTKALASVAILGLAAHPMQASAADCGRLQQADLQLAGNMTKLILDHPGTHLLIGACAAVPDGNDTAEAAFTKFAACMGIGCYLTDVDNCVEVGKSWFILGLQKSMIDDQMKNCGS